VSDSDPLSPFESWEDCRDFYALEAIFLGQLLDRKPGKANRKRYGRACDLASAANERCAEPLPSDDATTVKGNR